MGLTYLLAWALVAQMPIKDICARAPVLDVNAVDLPASCMVDFGREPEPAGRCGRVFPGTDGRLYFEDGTRAVFWGVNIAKEAVFQPREVVDEAVEALASAGFNLVRFHHFDDVYGLLPRERAGQVPRIDPGKRAGLDYWVYRLGQRGIYVYLDLLDYRTFWPEEGVPDGEALGRGAKPYAVFVPRLVELQAAYARELLCEHVNPHTGKTYAQDPAVLFIELCDENGLFRAAKRGLELRAPHDRELKSRFSAWLLERYGDQAGLQRAWTDGAGLCCLGDREVPEEGTVRLGSLDGGTSRDTDTALFFAAVHGEYFAALREAVMSGGATGLLLGGVAEPSLPPDLRAAAQGLDFVGVNWYWDHPIFAPDRPWQLPYSYRNTSTMQAHGLESFPVVAAAARVEGKPLVVREWCPCWPNKYRAAAFLEAAAYGAVQDVDALMLFHFEATPARRKIGLFDVSHDPVRWGLAALAGQVFLRRLVPIASPRVVVGYSPADVLLSPMEAMASPLHKLGYVCRVSNAFFEDELKTEADLVVSSGRSAEGRYPQRRALLFSNSTWADPYRREATGWLDERNGCEVATVPRVQGPFGFGGTVFGEVRRELTADPAYFLPDVVNNPDLRPIGRCAQAQAAFGVRNMALQRYCFKRLPGDLALRAALDALGQTIGDESLTHRMVDGRVMVSAGGHVRVDANRNLLAIEAPQVLALAGDLDGGTRRAGALGLSTRTQQGAVVWLSLDGQSPATSKRWVLKMVSLAVNTDEVKQLARRNERGNVYTLVSGGVEPVLTLGHPGGRTLVTLGSRPLVALDLVNGTWEMVRDEQYVYLWCDVPGTRFEVPLVPSTAQVDEVRDGRRGFAGHRPQPLEYPPGVQLVRLSPVMEGPQ